MQNLTATILTNKNFYVKKIENISHNKYLK